MKIIAIYTLVYLFLFWYLGRKTCNYILKSKSLDSIKKLELLALLTSIIIFPLLLGSIISSSKQTEHLKNQTIISSKIDIFDLAYRALPYTNWGGDSSAYDSLLNLKDKITDKEIINTVDDRLSFIRSQYFNIEDFVKSFNVNNNNGVDISNDVPFVPDNITWIIDQLNHSGYWITRAKCSKVIRDNANNIEKLINRYNELKTPKITKDDIFKKLYNNLKNKPSLTVKVMALEAYDKLDHSFEVDQTIPKFDFKRAIQHHETRYPNK